MNTVLGNKMKEKEWSNEIFFLFKHKQKKKKIKQNAWKMKKESSTLTATTEPYLSKTLRTLSSLAL